MVYTDTDSLILDIKTDDVYKKMISQKDDYDISDFPIDHPLHDDTNKKVIGKMKDECAGVPISEFIGLKPKIYAILKGNKCTKKAKGVKKYVVKHLNFACYQNTLFNKQTYMHKMNMLRSYLHRVYNMTLNKVTLSPLDTKRYTEDGITTRAFGFTKST